MHKLMNIIKDAGAIRAYEFREFFGINKPINELGRNVSGGFDKPDARYNVPKESPKASEELVTKTIEDTEIYRRAKGRILRVQRKQVAYGLDKYPEPLNADTWSTIETIDHIIDESIDKLHYLVMLKIKLEREADTGITRNLDTEEDREDIPYSLYADGEKYMTRNSPDYDIGHIELADEVKIDGGDVEATIALHRTFANEDLDAMRYALPAERFVKMAKDTNFEREVDKAASDLIKSHKSLYTTDVLVNKTFDIDFNGKNLYVECKDIRMFDDVDVMYLLENMYGDKFWLSKDELQKSIIEKG